MLPLTPPAASDSDRLGRMMGTKRIKNSNSSCHSITCRPTITVTGTGRLEDSERSCFTIHKDSDSESLRLASNCSFSTDFDSGITLSLQENANFQ